MAELRSLPIIGVIHLLPLPGSPRNPSALSAVEHRARQDALEYTRSGVDALLVENHGDAPFEKDDVEPHVPAIMAVIARALGDEFRCPVGINVLRNDVGAALGAAAACGASFVRANVLSGVTATDQGLIEGQAARWLRYRRQLALLTEIWADIDVKFGTAIYAPPADVLVRGLVSRAGAERLIVTGAATGSAPSEEALRAVKSASTVPVLLGSGLSIENVDRLLPLCDGAIVGSAFKVDGEVDNPVDPGRVTALMHRVRAVRLRSGAPA